MEASRVVHVVPSGKTFLNDLPFILCFGKNKVEIEAK